MIQVMWVAFNRTSVELKHHEATNAIESIDAFNRTSVELKLPWVSCFHAK